jgi:hypothetical protein
MNKMFTALFFLFCLQSFSQETISISGMDQYYVTITIQEDWDYFVTPPLFENGFATIYSDSCDVHILPVAIEVATYHRWNNMSFSNFIEYHLRGHIFREVQSMLVVLHTTIEESGFYVLHSQLGYQYVAFLKGTFGIEFVKLETKWFETELNENELKTLVGLVQSVEILGDKP